MGNELNPSFPYYIRGNVEDANKIRSIFRKLDAKFSLLDYDNPENYYYLNSNKSVCFMPGACAGSIISVKEAEVFLENKKNNPNKIPQNVAIQGDRTLETGKKIIDYFLSKGGKNRMGLEGRSRLYYFLDLDKSITGVSNAIDMPFHITSIFEAKEFFKTPTPVLSYKKETPLNINIAFRLTSSSIGKKILDHLENLGGKNRDCLQGNGLNWYYYICPETKSIVTTDKAPETFVKIYFPEQYFENQPFWSSPFEEKIGERKKEYPISPEECLKTPLESNSFTTVKEVVTVEEKLFKKPKKRIFNFKP
jgi:hypothetical protein